MENVLRFPCITVMSLRLSGFNGNFNNSYVDKLHSFGMNELRAISGMTFAFWGFGGVDNDLFLCHFALVSGT